MNKSILIINIPKSCNKCPVYHEGYGHCNVVRSFIKDDTQVDSRCPLKPMPQKKNSIVYQGEVDVDIPIDFLEKIHNQGYNDCIDEILGEEE